MEDIRRLTHREFPQLLREINDPPEALYLKGSLPHSENKMLTVVGSRRMSRYGKDSCEYLIKGLAGYPVTIVSGLALGIDGIAHRAAMEAGLPTIAVPGSGLLDSVLYPRAHVGLAREIIIRGGALLSEMKPDEKATTYSFPKRNRLMAGMSHATLIIEAGEKSGTLITARLTVDYNRDLLIVPHSIFSEGGAGGHIFLKIGAKAVRTSLDILESLGIDNTQTAVHVQLNEAEELVMTLLNEPCSRDELIRSLHIPIGDVNVLLASMEIRGLLAESLGEVRKLL